MKFRKKPVVIDAIRLTEKVTIQTLEGTMVGEAGDWLITGVAGEKYPCKNSIFEATYEAVDNLSDAEPPPKQSDSPPMWDLVVDDMKERDRIGEKKYGRRLQAHNGRDPLIDAFQEHLDLIVYLRQAIFEKLGR